MNIIDKFIVRQLEKLIKDGVEIRNDPPRFREYKQILNNKFGIFFYNVMKTNDRDVFTIMAKRKTATYIYSYNITTNDLILKGERRNVNT